MYVWTVDGTVLVLILNHFKGCGENSVELTFILFDQYGKTATSCNAPTKQTTTAPNNPYYITFDSKYQNYFHIYSWNKKMI